MFLHFGDLIRTYSEHFSVNWIWNVAFHFSGQPPTTPTAHFVFPSSLCASKNLIPAWMAVLVVVVGWKAGKSTKNANSYISQCKQCKDTLLAALLLFLLQLLLDWMLMIVYSSVLTIPLALAPSLFVFPVKGTISNVVEKGQTNRATTTTGYT